VSYDAEDTKQFHGRAADGETCWLLHRRKPFFILEGESRCGKSSLLNVDLIPRARDVFRVIGPCRCGEDPFGELRSALLGERYERGRNYSEEALCETIEQVAQAPGGGAVPPLLVCIDQFEEVFVTVKDQVRQRFFEALRESIAAGRLRLLLAIRKDFSDLLFEACREDNPELDSFAFDPESYYHLRSFTETQAEGTLDRMLDREELHGNDQLRPQELRAFARALVVDLLRPPLDTRPCREDEKRVLPVELQMVGWTYESLLPVRRFAAAELRRRGGKVGLYRDYIEDAKEYAFRRTGMPGAKTILVLRRLISPARTRWPQSASEIAGSGLGLSTPQVETLLKALADRYIVRRLPDEGAGEVGSGRYELLHEHLVQLLAEAPEPVLQRARDAEARLRFWLDRTRSTFAPTNEPGVQARRSRFRTLSSGVRDVLRIRIPLSETFGLWRHASDPEARRMLRTNLRSFLLWAVLLLAVALIPTGTWWIARALRERSPAYQVEYIIRQSPFEIVDTEGEYAHVGLFEIANREKVVDVEHWTGQWLGALADAGRLDALKGALAKLSPQNVLEAADKAATEASAKAGRFDVVLKAAAEIADPFDKSRAYAAIAEAAAKAGEHDSAEDAIHSAIAAANRIEDPGYASLASEAVGRAAMRACRFDEALAIAGKITNEYQASAALAIAASESGKLETANRASTMVKHWYNAVEAYAALASAAAKAGERDAAKRAIETAMARFPVVPGAYETLSMKTVAEAASGAGLFHLVLPEVTKIEDPTRAAQMYLALTEPAGKAGKLDAVLELVSGKVKDRSQAIRAYGAVAKAGAKFGQRETATLAIDAALKLEKPSPHAEPNVYESLASAAAELGVLDKLTRAAKSGDDTFRSAIYVAVTWAAANAGKFDEARAAAENDPDRSNDYVEYRTMAEAAASAGYFEVASKAASQITDAEYSSRAHLSLASAAAKAGDLDIAKAAAKNITDLTYMSRAYSAIAVTAASLDQPDTMMAAFDWIKDPILKAEAQAAGSVAAAEAGHVEIAEIAEAAISSLPRAKSNARSAISAALARAGQFYEASIACEQCEPLDRLKAYTAILQAYTNKVLRHPVLKGS
jgi:hypothetical protein